MLKSSLYPVSLPARQLKIMKKKKKKMKI